LLRDLLFYGLAAVMLGLAAATVLARNLFRAALGLLGVLWCTAVLFIVLRAEMVALVQVMVYIGGIMIFVIYAVLLTSELGGRMAAPSHLKAAGAVIVAGTVAGVIVGFARRSGSGESGLAAPGNIAALKSLGLRLLDPGPQGFLVPFELISVVLLAAMVGAIAIAREPKPPASGAPESRGGA
jgi:NADH-quinone oxidoreductase subunit J